MADGDDVRLRPIVEDDLAFLQGLDGDPDQAGPFMWFGFHDPREWRRRWDTGCPLIDDNGGRLVVLARGERAGKVSWRCRHWFGTWCWSVGIGLAPHLRGHGYGTRAHVLVVDYLFAHTQANRIEAHTETENAAERQALHKAGFTREGTLQGACFRDGHWRDGALYAITRADHAGGGRN
ncbi:MAG: GNAT family N-acetyltransferase [Nocardioidaceae bacterium]